MGADPSGDFGSTLRAARERKGISLRDIAARTKISLAALDALERNDIARLPGGIFSRAFVRAYALEVGLDPEQTIQDFIAHFPHESVTAGHPRSDRVEDTERFESDRRAASSVLWILAASVAVAAVVLFLNVARGGHEPGEASVASAAVADAGGGEPVLTPAATTGADAGIIETAGSSGSTPSSASATAAAESAAIPRATSLAEPAGLTVGLAARRLVWLSVTADGRKVIRRLLQPGEQETIELARELVMTAGDAAAVQMTLNGAEARTIGGSGEVVTVHVTPANYKEYLSPR